MKRQPTNKRTKARVNKTINKQLQLISQRNALRIRSGRYRPNVPRNIRSVQRTRQMGGLGTTIPFVPPRQVTRNNETRIVHREPLDTVFGSVGFAINTYELNPGIPATFPWLSAQAIGYESYKINSLSVEYSFTTNEFIGKGRIVIAPDYDAADDPPTTALEAEQMTDRAFGAVAKNHVCRLRPRGMGILGPKRYIRSGVLPPNEDIKTYDVAQLHVVTSGQTDASEIGQLWLNYDITLCEPQFVNAGQNAQSGWVTSVGAGSVSPSNVFGTTLKQDGNILISTLLNVITVNNLVPGSNYFILNDFEGTTFAGPFNLTLVSGGVLTAFDLVQSTTRSTQTTQFLSNATTAVFNINTAANTWATMTSCMLLFSQLHDQVSF